MAKLRRARHGSGRSARAYTERARWAAGSSNAQEQDMITLRVTSFNGQPLPAPLSADFPEGGGTIGRGESNRLVLADPERYVSRMQARVDYRNAQWLLSNQGANPITLNG